MATEKKLSTKATATKAVSKVAPKSTPKTSPKAVVKTASKAEKPAKKSKKAGNTVPEEQRAHYIEVAAFYIAERRGFAAGDPMDDWLAAEAEINQLLAEGRLG